MAELIVVRHGETEWSKSGRHTGTTDIALTVEGEEQARRLLADLGERSWAAVLVSPRQRARRTAELAGIAEYEVLDDLAEWDYGVLEGHTTAEYEARRTSVGLPRWQLFADGAPGSTPVSVRWMSHSTSTCRRARLRAASERWLTSGATTLR